MTQAWWEGGLPALRLLLLMGLAWCAVFMVARLVEWRLRGPSGGGRGHGGASVLGTAARLWEYSNVIGIPTLLLGAAYLIWAMNWGPGLEGGPTMLIILAMMAAGFLIGFGPGLRR